MYTSEQAYKRIRDKREPRKLADRDPGYTLRHSQWEENDDE